MTIRFLSLHSLVALLLATLAVGACGSSDDSGGAAQGPGVPGNAPNGPTGAGEASGLPSDVARRLERALSIYRGEAIELGAAIASRFDAPGSALVETARTTLGTTRPNATAEVINYRCSNGGTLRSIDETDETGLIRDRRTTYSNCRIGAYSVTGESRRGANPVPGNIVLPAPYTAADLEPFYSTLALQLVDTRDGSRIELGPNTQAFTGFTLAGQTTTLLSRNWASTGDSPLTFTAGDGSTTRVVSAVGISYEDNTGSGQIDDIKLSGSDIQLSGDGADALSSIVTTRQFQRTIGDANFATGELTINGAGFSYVMDAGNGDPNSFQVNVETNGSTTAYTVPWSERFALEDFRPLTVDLGIGG